MMTIEDLEAKYKDMSNKKIIRDFMGYLLENEIFLVDLSNADNQGISSDNVLSIDKAQSLANTFFK